jgi:hypothetical protein
MRRRNPEIAKSVHDFTPNYIDLRQRDFRQGGDSVGRAV